THTVSALYSGDANFVASSGALSPDQVVAPVLVTGITPNIGPAAGGNLVTLNGFDFTGATSGLFGSVPALSFTVNSDNRISAIAPAQPMNTVVFITVTTAAGTSPTSTVNQYTYDPPVTPLHGHRGHHHLKPEVAKPLAEQIAALHLQEVDELFA